jgi:hypothetical protein
MSKEINEMKVRNFSLISIFFTAVGLLDNFRLVLTGHLDTPGWRTFDNISAIFLLFSAAGVIFAVISLIELKATGANPVFRVLSYLPIIGAVTLILGYILLLTGMETETVKYLGAFGQLVSMGGMVIVAILALAAKRLASWRKFTPLVTVLAIPVGALVVGLTGQDGWFGIVYRSAFLVLGLALFTAQPMAEKPHELAAVS